MNDIEAYADADARFHYLVMEQSGNRLAANITQILFQRARVSRRFTGTASPGGAGSPSKSTERFWMRSPPVTQRPRRVQRATTSREPGSGADPPTAARPTRPPGCSPAPGLSPGARSRPGSLPARAARASSSKPNWQGSVRDHHCFSTGSAAMRAWSAS